MRNEAGTYSCVQVRMGTVPHPQSCAAQSSKTGDLDVEVIYRRLRLTSALTFPNFAKETSFIPKLRIRRWGLLKGVLKPPHSPKTTLHSNVALATRYPLGDSFNVSCRSLDGVLARLIRVSFSGGLDRQFVY